MVLTATEAGIDDTVTLEGASLMNSALTSQDSILSTTQIPISVKREVSHCKNIYTTLLISLSPILISASGSGKRKEICMT